MSSNNEMRENRGENWSKKKNNSRAHLSFAEIVQFRALVGEATIKTVITLSLLHTRDSHSLLGVRLQWCGGDPLKCKQTTQLDNLHLPSCRVIIKFYKLETTSRERERSNRNGNYDCCWTLIFCANLNR